jgi:hypothetical protein
LGEFQLAFVVFLYAECPEAMRAWVTLGTLLLGSEAALREHASLAEDLAVAIEVQLDSAPDEIIPPGFALTAPLARFAALVRETGPPRAAAAMARVRAMFPKRFSFPLPEHRGGAGADADDLEDEDGPVIVDLEAGQLG